MTPGPRDGLGHRAGPRDGLGHRAGRLVLCGTPIGNLEDASPRLIRTLGDVDVVACEDTRRTRKLLTHFGIAVKDLMTYNEQNERRRVPELLTRMARGETVALVSDAGMPGLSDPGYRLVRACVEQDYVVEVVPGPNAAISALAVSGLPPARFIFEGFLPRKSGERRRRLEDLKLEARTLVFYESPHRIAETLTDAADVLGTRPAALVRELTKIHEEVRRGTLEELADSVREAPPKGEIVLVVGGAIHSAKPAVSPAELARRARDLMEQGIDRKEAMSNVARESGVPRRAVFDALLEDGRDEAD
ncbi:MAG: rRNA (cytidine1402-2-O)-methyltransferase [Actinomycetota bacterium]|nr:rRNA (cytidine1402-2-O)-methyltransferase [Actinomycetota bacterium]